MPTYHDAFLETLTWERREAQEDRLEASARLHFSPGERAAQVEEELREISRGLRGIRPNPLIPGKGKEEG